MLRDARELPEGHRVEAEVCVIGSGPAGTTLARELARRGVSACVLESGGLESEPQAQTLNEGETEGDGYRPLAEVRHRRFGGTANIWDSQLDNRWPGFRGAPLDAIDFEPRDWVPHSGWPFGREELEPFYERAQAVCGFGPSRYDVRAWESPDAPRLPYDDREVDTCVWQFGAQRTFTTEPREELERAPGITVYLHATAVELETDEAGGTVTAVRAASLGGPEFRVRASVFVLAGGGIENARLLLLSNRARPEGLGNQHDLVGRFFMEHQLVRCGTLIPADRRLVGAMALYDERRVDGAVLMGQLRLTPDVMRRERLLNGAAMFLPRHRWYRRVREDAILSLEALLSSALRLRVPEHAGRHLRSVALGLDYVAAAALRKVSGRRLFPYFAPGPGLVDGAGWSALPDRDKRFAVFEVLITAEQAPDPANRVTLGEGRDALGCRRARLHWRWNQADVASLRRTQDLLARETARSGLGQLRVERDGDRPRLILSGLHHHMGTTRMHRDPRNGVVDENARVHGVANLFVAGCSVFPTGGYMNPTLTIVALALRLADHLAKTVASSEPVPLSSTGTGAAPSGVSADEA